MLLIPMTVMASSAVEPGLGATLIVVAKMGDKEYATLEELAAEFGDKVSYEDNKMILVEDLELTNTLYIGQADDDKDDEANKNENSDVPTTGDVVLPVSIALVVVSLAGIAFFVVKNRKIKK